MTIVLTAGGSGGHITPLLAVAAELKRRNAKTTIIYIGQTGDLLGDIPANDPNIDQTYTVRAGKFRRYHGEGLKQLLDVKTMYLNARDAIYVGIGLYQSWRLLKKLQPDMLFTRGGFVSVPVALSAKLRNIPYITHDSDAVPSLANRIIARWAAKHAVALPKDIYPYRQDRTVTTGIPLQKDFVPVTDKLKAKYRQELNLPDTAKLLFVVGGGLGSQRVNGAVGEAIPHLLREFKDLRVIQVAGRANEAALQQQYAEKLMPSEQAKVVVKGYVNDIFRHSGAADLIITRAGATNLAEFALQGKACIVVPSPFLTGGHQLKNAYYLAENNAAVVLDEAELLEDPNRLAKQVSELLNSSETLDMLGDSLAAYAKPKATAELADLILNTAGQ